MSQEAADTPSIEDTNREIAAGVATVPSLFAPALLKLANGIVALLCQSEINHPIGCYLKAFHIVRNDENGTFTVDIDTDIELSPEERHALDQIVRQAPSAREGRARHIVFEEPQGG